MLCFVLFTNLSVCWGVDDAATTQATTSVCKSVGVDKVDDADTTQAMALVWQIVDYNTMTVSVYWGINDTKKTIHATA